MAVGHYRFYIAIRRVNTISRPRLLAIDIMRELHTQMFHCRLLYIFYFLESLQNIITSYYVTFIYAKMLYDVCVISFLAIA